MSERLPRVTARQMTRALHGLGFHLVRQSGSHQIFKNDAGRRVTVPYHAGKILHPKLLVSIMQDAGIDAEQLRKLL